MSALSHWIHLQLLGLIRVRHDATPPVQLMKGKNDFNPTEKIMFDPEQQRQRSRAADTSLSLSIINFISFPSGNSL